MISARRQVTRSVRSCYMIGERRFIFHVRRFRMGATCRYFGRDHPVSCAAY